MGSIFKCNQHCGYFYADCFEQVVSFLECFACAILHNFVYYIMRLLDVLMILPYTLYFSTSRSFHSPNTHAFSPIQTTSEIEREEAVLQNLAVTTNKQKSTLQQLEENIKLHKSELDILRRSHQDKINEFEKLQKEVVEVTELQVSPFPQSSQLAVMS